MKALWTGLLLTAGAILPACSSTSTPPPELLDARYAYQRASEDPNAGRVSADLAQAKRELAMAEQSYADGDDEATTKNLAYVAGRDARGARAKANSIALMDEEQRAQSSFARWQESENQKRLLARQAESERQARVAAMARERSELERLSGVEVTNEGMNTVVTVVGSSFASGKGTLTDVGKQRFTDIARAMKDDPRSISVRGYTDSTGSDSKNMEVSQQRADTVRNFLIEQGLQGSKITTQAYGKQNPIADNGTANGRARNRRVELLLQ